MSFEVQNSVAVVVVLAEVIVSLLLWTRYLLVDLGAQKRIEKGQNYEDGRWPCTIVWRNAPWPLWRTASSPAGMPISGLFSKQKRFPIDQRQSLSLGSWTPFNCFGIESIIDRVDNLPSNSENGKHLALSTSDLCVHILSTTSLGTIWRLKDAHAFPGTCLAFSPRGDVLVSGSADMTLRVIKVESDEEPATMYHIFHSKWKLQLFKLAEMSLTHKFISGKEATIVLAILLALLAFYLQHSVAPDLPMESSLEWDVVLRALSINELVLFIQRLRFVESMRRI